MKIQTSIVVSCLLASIMLSIAFAPVASAANDWDFETLETASNGDFMSAILLDSSGNPQICYASSSGLSFTYKSGGTWTTDIIAGGSCSYPSMVIDRDGYIHVSYIDGNDHVRYARKSGSSWTTESVDSSRRFTYYTDIAVDYNYHPHIVYQDVSNGELKYADRGISNWNYETVSTDASTHRSVIAIDSQDSIHIAYYDDSHNNVKYAKRIDTSTAWNPLTVMSKSSMNGELDIALDSSDNPHILAGLEYASYDGSSWNTETLSSPESGTLDWVSLTVDEVNNPHASIQQNNALLYTVKINDTWEIEIIDDGDTGYYNTIAVDSSEHPHITYYDEGVGQLVYASGQPYLDPTDTDLDGLLDTWEQSNFGNLTLGPTDDFDDDGHDNLAEYNAGTDPKDDSDYPGSGEVDPNDTDSDNLPDAWEIDNFGDLMQGPSNDPDGDGYSNLAEYNENTAPMDATDFPSEDEEDNSGDNIALYAIIALAIIVIIVGLLVFMLNKNKGGATPPPEQEQGTYPPPTPVEYHPEGEYSTPAEPQPIPEQEPPEGQYPPPPPPSPPEQ